MSSWTLAQFGAQNRVEPTGDTHPLRVNEVEIRTSKSTLTDTRQASGEQIHPGDIVEVKLKLNIEPGYHAYLDQYKLTLLAPKDYYLSEFQIRPTVKFADPISKKFKVGTESYAEMVSLLEVPKEATGGPRQLKLELTYQACGKDFCLFPQKIVVEKNLNISGGQNELLARALEKGWLSALFLVFAAGFLTSLTPCIFPMIPITLAILGTKGHSRTRWQGFILSLVYVLGIALTYSVLGVAAAKTGALFGSLLGHPIVISLVAALFVLMGLSMYGLFDVQMPIFITNRLAHGRQQKGLIGAFGSGLIAGVVASPCVGPVLISVLAYVAQTQNTVVGFVLLFTFALGLGQLFLVIGTFNTILQKLPKSGPWMEQVKFIFGSIMIGMALYYIYPVAHGPIFDGLTATTLIAIATYFGAFKPKTQLHTKKQKAHKALMFTIFLLGLLFAVKSLVPKHLQEGLFVTSGQSAETLDVPKPDWFNYSDELLEKANREGRPVILDFKADWCLACKELEVYTFSDPRILELGKRFIWLTFDATSPSEELSKLQKKYGIGGLPYVVIYNSKGAQEKSLTLTGFEKADFFLERMKKAL